MLSEAELWERGSRNDQLRNEFVVPALINLLKLRSGARLLDVGAGTGYVARTVDSQLLFRPHWTLIDTSAERLAVAETLRSNEMVMETIADDVFDWACEAQRFDAILLSFTLLEIPSVERLVRLFSEWLVQAGLLLIVVPDAWPDVLRHSRSNPDALGRFLAGSVEVPKLDKFTKTQYPFHAMRTESVIEAATENGFDLFSLRRGVVGSAAAFVLAFRLRAGSR